ncbi:PEP/pyruvate-binding domain-containing protein, partial [Staphylococcus hyicus]|uniref:PEP/pyruvate-binding domain-containing protein n=1 Tax=Staphylococcus hyicus TaxID=1284 RepID=UPI001F544F82
RLVEMRRFILSSDEETRIQALNQIREYQTEDFEHIFRLSGERTGKAFSDDQNLLLVSVRSGAKISMPGMMDTILNLGLNDDNV